MPKFQFDGYTKLINKSVLLFMKKSYTLTEAEIIEITQHRIRVRPLSGKTVVGIRKDDVIILPLRISRKRLNNLIKTANTSKNDLFDYIDEYAYKLSH